ncbi:phosphotransferase enzyme family protein, partial [Bacillus sp. JJ722]|uniref:phosphotransferase enzyme family protein n=1 Tax=Bacillus sp. JJ722 TaxID=3122973 RepID=UPI002FFE24A7
MNEKLHEELISTFIHKNYDMVVTECLYLRRSFNDHYFIKTDSNKYIFRVYVNKKHYIQNANDLLFELDYLLYLNEMAIPVSIPIVSRSNKTLVTLERLTDIRYVSMFTFAKGTPLQYGLSCTQAYLLGETIARMHEVSKGFTSCYSRYTLDVHHLIVEPLQEIEYYTSLYQLGSVSFFQEKADSWIEELLEMPINRLTFGLVHGDLNPSNIHFCREQGFTLFDFDHCGFGFYIHDLAVTLLSFAPQTFLNIVEGYQSIRPLLNEEKRFIKTYADILLLKKYKDILN